MGAGKTTAISALSEIDVINTDVMNTDRSMHHKALTTVGIDYGQIILPPDVKIGLYGTPGQDRFNFIWKIVAKGAIGAIVLIDATAKDALHLVTYYTDFFTLQNLENIVIGISHVDKVSPQTIAQFHEYARARELPFPLFEIDARKKEDVLLLIETLISAAEAALY